MQGHLKNAALISGLQASHAAEKRIAEQRIRICPIWVIQNVQGLSPELQIRAFMQPKTLEQ